MRLTIGLNFPKKQRASIHRSCRALREEGLPVRWLEPDDFHVTMKFLGEIRRDQVASIEERVAKVAAATKSFTTEFAGFGAFPTIRRPEVLWLGVSANAELRCLKQDLEWNLGDLGFGAETRSFHPHVTLGRADGSGGAGVFRALDTVMAGLDYDAELKVHSVDIIRSRLTPEGIRYKVISSSRLSAK